MTDNDNEPSALCADIEGWYDSYGPDYNCDWYASNPETACIEFGAQHQNFGHTANTACCACANVTSTNNADPSPTLASTSANDNVDYPSVNSVPNNSPTFYDGSSYSDHINSNTVVIILSILAVLVLTVVGILCYRTRTTRQQRNATASTNNVNAPSTTEDSTSKNNHAEVATLRIRILNILLPPQPSIRKEQMTYDAEEQSYRYDAAANDDGEPSSSSSTSCGICLDYFAEGDVLMIGLCQHAYHRDCCMGWVMKQNSCPQCRKQMFDESSYNRIKETILKGIAAEKC